MEIQNPKPKRANLKSKHKEAKAQAVAPFGKLNDKNEEFSKKYLWRWDAYLAWKRISCGAGAPSSDPPTGRQQDPQRHYRSPSASSLLLLEFQNWRTTSTIYRWKRSESRVEWRREKKARESQTLSRESARERERERNCLEISKFDQMILSCLEISIISQLAPIIYHPSKKINLILFFKFIFFSQKWWGICGYKSALITVI